MRDLPPRFELRGALGRGGAGDVARVFDRERGAEVALKRLAPRPGADPTRAEAAFAREYWALATFRHPHLAAAHDWLRLPDGTPAFTMDLVEGVPLAEAGPQDEATLRGWLPGLLGALDAIHAHGFVHGDLKPANVRLGPDGRAVLMDLGTLARAGAWDGELAGSLEALAPEALREGACDRRADLYALGLLVWRALAGRGPFDDAAAEGPAALLRAHLERVPPPLRAHAPAASPALEALVARLLAKRPADRPADVAEVRARLGLPAVAATGPAGAAAELLEGPLIGRGELLERLAAYVQARRAASGRLVGPPGSGRSRLLRQVRVRAQLDGRPAVAVRGLGRDAAPYAALAGLLRGLLAAPAADDEAGRAAAAFFDVGAPAPGSPLDAPREKLRAHEAIAELALAAWPEAVWLVDDADALDPASAELVALLRRRGADRPWRWLLVGAAPVGGAVAGDDLEAEADVWPLEPLDEAGLAALAADALGGPAPGGLATALAALAGGWPGRARALLARWRQEGALVRTDATWSFDAAAATVPAGEPAVDGGLAGLDAGALALARLAAVLGERGTLPDLQALAQVTGSGPEAMDAGPEGAAAPGDEPGAGAFGARLWALAGAGVLEVGAGRYAFVEPARALALRAGLPEAGQRALHARCFARLAGGEGPAAARSLEALLATARHAVEARVGAGDAWLWVLAAVRRALAAAEVDAADRLLRAAEALGTPSAIADEVALLRAHVLRARGEVDAALALLDDERLARLADDPARAQHVTTRGVLLQLKGRYPEALARYREAAELAAGDPAARVRAHLFAGRTAFFMGEAVAAGRHLEAAVAASAEPGGERHRAWAEALHGHWLATRGGADAARGRARLDDAVARARAERDPYVTHEALNNLGDARLAAGRPAEARAAFAECLAIAIRHGLGNETLFGHINLALAANAAGEPRLGRRHALLALEGARRQGRRYPEGVARTALGVAETLGGDPAGGLAELGEALALARGSGNRYLALQALVARAEAFALLGAWDAAGADAREAAALAAETGDHEHDARLAVVRAQVAALAGQGAEPEAAPAVAPASGEGDLYRAVRAHAAGEDPTPALAAADAAAALLGLGRLRAEVALVRAGAGLLAAGDLAAALADAREAGLALHEAALADLLAGKLPDRPELRREAARRLREIAAPLDGPARAALAAHPWWAAAARDPEGAEADPLARFATLVAELAGLAEPGAMLDRALLAAVDVAEAERGFLVLYDGLAVTASRRVGREEPGFEAFSLGLAHRVLFSGQPCFLEDVTADADLAGRESVRGLGVRAVAAVPLRVGGAVAGVLITDARQPRRRPWGPERTLLAALADHVAVAVGRLALAEAARADRDAVAAAHRLALAAMAAPTGEAARDHVLAEARARVGASACWTWALADGPPAGAPAAVRALAGWVAERREPVAVPHEEAGARGAAWALPVGERHALALVRDAGGPPREEETAVLARLAEVLAAALARMDATAERLFAPGRG